MFGFGETSLREIFANGIPAITKCKKKGTSTRVLYLEIKIVKYSQWIGLKNQIYTNTV